jgi:ABC-type transport system substrate-binding protein
MMRKLTYIIVGVIILSFLTSLPIAKTVDIKPVFRYGVTTTPQTLDPAYAWDSASIDIIDQVMEGLVAYDLFDPEMAIIPRLATNIGIWNTEGTELTFTLRQDVTICIDFILCRRSTEISF